MADPRFGGSERDYMGGVGSLGFDRMGGPRATPPANIGIDRAGAIRGNYNEGYRPGDVTELPLTEPSPSQTYGRNIINRLQQRSYKKKSRIDSYVRDALGMMPPLTRTSFDDMMRGWETTTPERYMPPDRYGRSRPTLNPYEGAKIGGAWDQAAVDPSDWRTWDKIIKAGGNPDDYASMNTGIGGLGVPDEYQQMAELSDKQKNWMGSPIGTPDFYSNFGDYFNAVTGEEDKGFLGLGFGGQKEPPTQQEVIDYLGESYVDEEGRSKTLPWPVV